MKIGGDFGPEEEKDITTALLLAPMLDQMRGQSLKKAFRKSTESSSAGKRFLFL